MRIWLVILIAGTFLASCINVCAQSVNAFTFEHITVDEGLAHSDAMAVSQDSNGFIWIGTNNGINRYDGYELKKYELYNPRRGGLSSNRIRTLHSGRAGYIWAGTERAGLFYYDPANDVFKNVLALTKSQHLKQVLGQINQTSVRAVISDQNGRVWVGTQDYGVFVCSFDRSNQIVGVDRVRLAVSGKKDFDITSLQMDQHGKMWIGTLGGGLWQFDADQLKEGDGGYFGKKVLSWKEDDVRALYQDRNGDFWIGSDQKVYKIRKSDIGNGQPGFVPLNTIFRGVQCFFMDSSRRLWVGTNSGLMMTEGTKGEAGIYSFRTFLPSDGDPKSINSGRIHQILEDSFSNLWLAASSGGVNKVRLNPGHFAVLSRDAFQKSSLPNNYVNVIRKDEQHNQLFIGTRNGFSRYNPDDRHYDNFLNRELQGNVTGVDVASLYVGNQAVWVGTRYNGLYLLDRKSGKNLRSIPSAVGFKPWNYVSIESIVADKYQQVWVGTTEGLLLYDQKGNHVRSFHIDNSTLPSHQFTYLLYDNREDVIWASTADSGVLKLKVNKSSLQVLNHFKHNPIDENSLKVNYAWPLLQDKSGHIWVGTIGGGLHRLVKEKEQYRVERFYQWLPENDIESILADEKGNLWIGGAGLFRFRPDTKKYVHYDVSDGLQSNSFKVGSAYHSADGTMYFGGTNGLNYFKPEMIRANPHAPVVHITRLRVLNRNPEMGENDPGSSMVTRSFSDPQGVTIKASENDFSFEFVGLNYSNPQKQRYAYFLEGYSSDWVQLPDGQRVASFANIPAGTYVFKVKASNGEGVWSAKPAEVKVVILPPWYKTWWAYMAYALITFGTLLLYRKLTLSQLKLKNSIALEKLHAEKEKEIAEVKINFFTNVSHEFRTPLTLILGPMQEFMAALDESGEMKSKVEMMHKQTQKLLNLVNQLLSFRKVETGNETLSVIEDDILEFINEIFLIFRLKADECNIRYDIMLPGQKLKLFYDPDKIEIILTNLLSNAFKYTAEGGEVSVDVQVRGDGKRDAVFLGGELSDNYLEIAVKDSGSGIGVHDLQRIFDPYYQVAGLTSMKGTGIGLALVKQFVDSHFGTVSVTSKPGEGSAFVVKLPFGKAHLSAEQISDKKQVSFILPREEQHTLPSSRSEPNSGNRYKMLIVEDNADLRTYLSDLFGSAFEVFSAEDGLDGWSKIPELQPDFILSDVMMPGMNGLELCKKIKSNPKTAHIPVVLLTARVAAVQELEGLETGADDYIQKPFNPRILKAKVNAVLLNRNKLHQYYQRSILLQPAEIVIPDEDRNFLENAMKLVEHNLTNPDFNVQSLVSMMGMSQSVFYKRVKSITGQSVIEFIKDIRLKRAAHLLANGHARVSEIAMMVGIEDPKNFRVSFQKIYHMSPSQYAREHRQNIRDENTTE
ncbi:MAG TPA: two-component regulator propeller domain-containing protein [Dyadobacter sp.]|nr:two-component regulator propeller domain-containing protein [Dyadobacter sp.]